MRRSIRRRRIVAVMVGAAAFVGSTVVTAQLAGGAPAKQYCSLQITGQKADGEFTTSPLTCSTSAPAVTAASSGGMSTMSGGLLGANIVALHFTGFNLSGSQLTIVGNSCTGGWLNMPAGWTNTISSTLSDCWANHFDYYNLTGSSESMSPGGGNLSALNDKTNSASYT